MALVNILVAGAPATPGRKMVIIPDGDAPIEIPYADPETDLTNLGWEWAEIGRPGDRPVTSRNGRKLARMGLHFTVADPNPTQPVENILARIGQLGIVPVTIVYGATSTSWATLTTGRWIVSDLSIKVTQRVPGTNDANRADVTLTVTEHTALPQLIAVPGGVTQQSVPRVRIGILYFGETFYQAVARYYPGDPGAWRRVADANGFRDVRNIPAGATLVLP